MIVVRVKRPREIDDDECVCSVVDARKDRLVSFGRRSDSSLRELLDDAALDERRHLRGEPRR
jgi:hypothetical protein